ncbi:MAG: adenylate kinase [Lachnospiraceae bacterium]|nr:adenylate kinase [Lachnospiraceae bacterium]
MNGRVYLIGGSSHVGKTLVAQKIMEDTMIPYVSIDHIKMGLIRAGITDITAEEDDAMREYIWPMLAEMAKTVIENDQSLIMEGCYIPPDWRKCLDETYLEHIREVFIVMSEDYVRTHIDDIKSYGSVIEHRLYDEVDCERLVRCSAWFKSDAQKFGNSYVEIDKEYNTEKLVREVEEKLGVI